MDSVASEGGRNTEHGKRVRRGQDRARAAGVRIGRPHVIDAATLARARAMSDDGRTIREVASALRVKRSTIARALARSVARP